MWPQGSDPRRENGHVGDAVPVSWEEGVERERARYRDGEERLPDEPDARQRQLVRMANAANGAGLCLLMLGRPDEAREWLVRAAGGFPQSPQNAPPGNLGRPARARQAPPPPRRRTGGG